MDFLRTLADPALVAKFQRLCGVEIVKPVTCDQQTQTRRQSSDSDSSSSSEQGEHNAENLSNGHLIANGHSANADIDFCKPSQQGVDTNTTRHRNGTRTSKGTVESNNNTRRINNNNLTPKKHVDNDDKKALENKVKRASKKNGYHIIEPSSRVHSKGSIFECNGHPPSADPTTVNNGNISAAEDPSAPLPTTAFRIKYKSLLYLARFGAFLGNEEFYLTFFPFCIWNLDFLVVRQVSMLWCVVMYLGQATKDYLCWPRPACPPVVRLETHYIQEYSMPSTHAMAGTAIPLYMAYLVVERYQVPFPVAATIAFLWFSITCMSRLYLGVHTVLDLLVGFLYAIVIFFMFIRYVEGYDLYQQTHPFSAPVILVLALALCTFCYPSSHKNSSKGDAVQIVGALTGCAIGCWLGYQLGYMHEPEIAKPYFILWPTLKWFGLAMLRFLTGLLFVAVLHTFTRWWSIRFFSYIYGLDKPDKNSPGVMTAYKFTTYTIVGIGISLMVPLIHQQIGINRPAMFYEVL